MTPRLAMALASLAVVPATSALAGLEICNDTPVRQSVAIGYQSDGQWVSEGWWNVGAGDCSVVVGGDLKNRYYYVVSQAKGWTFEHENFAFCTTPDAFTITGDKDCGGRGYDEKRFRKIDTGKTAKSYSVNLAAFSRESPPEQPAAKAETPKSPTQGASDSPGTWGDPYVSDTAIMQDCVTETEAPFCSFHADGTKFFVYDDGRTPSWVIRTMASFLPGTPIEVSGDLVDVYDRTADVVLREALPRQWNRWDTMLDRMQGQWYAVDDPKAMFTVLGSERENTYDGAYSGLEYLGMADTCDHFDGGGILVARDEESGDTLCYSVEDIGDWSMTLMYLPGANFLEYRKLD